METDKSPLDSGSSLAEWGVLSPGMVLHACNPSTWQVEVGGPGVTESTAWATRDPVLKNKPMDSFVKGKMRESYTCRTDESSRYHFCKPTSHFLMVLAHAFDPSTQKVEAGGSLNLRLAWST